MLITCSVFSFQMFKNQNKNFAKTQNWHQTDTTEKTNKKQNKHIKTHNNEKLQKHITAPPKNKTQNNKQINLD